MCLMFEPCPLILQNLQKERIFYVSSFTEFLHLQNRLSHVYGVIKSFLEFESSKYGISYLHKKTTPNGFEIKITDNKGTDILKMSGNSAYTGSPERSFTLEIGNLKILDSVKRIDELNFEQKVVLSEYALGVTGALSETVYTSKGKQSSERVDAKTSIAAPLEPMTYIDADIVLEKIKKATKETSPRIQSRIPVKYESIFHRPPPKELSRVEKVFRSSIGR